MHDERHVASSVGLLSRWLRGVRRASARLVSILWLRELLVAVVLALVIITFLYQPVKVEGTSMEPGLGDQERIFINKFIYHFEPIARGDVIVFRYPRDPGKSFIKRVVGLPGETLEIRAGRVYINDVKLVEAYLTGESPQSLSFPPVTVPPDHYYVLGDHRSSSSDSRAWGPVHQRYIYGKAIFIYWPPERFGSVAKRIEPQGK
ncbi:MAG: signal peptidase I [Terriglobia bacterium]